MATVSGKGKELSGGRSVSCLPGEEKKMELKLRGKGLKRLVFFW